MNFCCPNCERLTRLIGLEPWWIAGPSERLAVGGKTGPNPTDRRKPGSKHHLITDANGLPLAAILTEANRHDVTQLLPLVAAIPPVGGSGAGRAADQTGFKVTEPITRGLIVGCCAPWELSPSWHSVLQAMAADWASTGG